MDAPDHANLANAIKKNLKEFIVLLETSHCPNHLKLLSIVLKPAGSDVSENELLFTHISASLQKPLGCLIANQWACEHERLLFKTALSPANL